RGAGRYGAGADEHRRAAAGVAGGVPADVPRVVARPAARRVRQGQGPPIPHGGRRLRFRVRGGRDVHVDAGDQSLNGTGSPRGLLARPAGDVPRRELVARVEAAEAVNGYLLQRLEEVLKAVAALRAQALRVKATAASAEALGERNSERLTQAERLAEAVVKAQAVLRGEPPAA